MHLMKEDMKGLQEKLLKEMVNEAILYRLLIIYSLHFTKGT